MGDISYVVVSTPRSGTGWMHRALSAMGLACGHETHFVYWLQRHGDPNRDGVWGDSSWLAAPFLGDLPDGVVVIHLVRNPLKSIASLVSLGHFDEWLPAKNPYKRFMQKHMPGSMPELATAIERAAWFWASWHRMIDLHIVSRPCLRTFPRSGGVARLEEAESWIPVMYREITGKPPEENAIDAAMSVDREYNTGRGKKPHVEWGMLPPRVIETAESYGYSV